MVVKLKDKLSESLALDFEARLISIFGLIALSEHNWLTNLDQPKY